MNVVSNTQQLEQRIADFFTLSDEHKKARVLLDTLACSCPAWIFGGMVRDLGLFGVEGFSSDLDIVIGRSREELFRTLAELPVKQLRSVGSVFVITTSNLISGTSMRHGHFGKNLYFVRMNQVC